MEPNSVYTLKDIIEEFRRDTKESLIRIEETGKETADKVGIQNGRVTKLEILSNDLVKVAEGNTEGLNNLKSHKAYLWGAFSVLTLLGGAIIYLSVAAIDSKIKDGVASALSEYEVEGVEIISK